MRFTGAALAATAAVAVAPALASWIPSAGQVIQEVDQLIHGHADSDLLSVEYGSFSGKSKKCTLKSGGKDDTDNFVQAVKDCGKGGVLHLPDPV
jgi:hypothetical protein